MNIKQKNVSFFEQIIQEIAGFELYFDSKSDSETKTLNIPEYSYPSFKLK